MRHLRVVLLLGGVSLALWVGFVAAPPVWATADRDQYPTPVPPSASSVVRIEIAQVDDSRYPEVTVYARLLDASGQKVAGLTQDQFALTEDGKAVDIIAFSSANQGAITTLLLMDQSGSMQEERKLEGAKSAALTFVDLMRPQDQTGLIAFDDSVHPLLDFTSDHAALQRQIAGLMPTSRTAWYDAVISAAQQMASISGRKSIFLLTDGLDNQSRNSFEAAVSEAKQAGAPVYTIGLGAGAARPGSDSGYDENQLRRMADETGGEFYHAPSADQLAALYRKLSQATQEEYVITYRSPRPSYDGTRRDIQITVGGVAGGSVYLEAHLLNIKSDAGLGLILGGGLILALIVPLLVHAGLSSRQPAGAVAPAAPAAPSPPVSWQPAGPSGPPPAASAMMACPYCGRQVRSTVRFCPACGKPLGGVAAAPPGPPAVPPAPAVPITMSCPKCGNTLRRGAKFCARCGNRL